MYDQPTDEDRYRMIRTYFQMLVDEIAIEEAAEAARAAAITAAGQLAREARNRDCVGKMKQFASWFTHGVPGGGALRKQIFEAKKGPKKSTRQMMSLCLHRLLLTATKLQNLSLDLTLHHLQGCHILVRSGYVSICNGSAVSCGA